ncbi:MutS-related protein [Edaphobacter sp.]|uniref:MutS-related protein n=1 Tax=Edaphobacter sp. TaxID=1934404 RepID=UPI002DB55E8F|nr:mismatch repair protein [Edaphobacter sp.]HEU5341253.1 mismatch repair protein [Edaphobacter sp.]
MSIAATPSPAEEYRQHQQARQTLAARFEKTHIRLGNLRLVIFLAAAIMAWFSLDHDTFSTWWLLAPVALFATIAVFHAHILYKRERAERAADHYAKGIARIEDRWTGNGQQTQRPETANHVYAADLDLFGPASLFELLSQARTRMGEDTLAHWLLAPSPIASLRQRHAAIDELRPRLDLREDIAVLEGSSRKDIKTGVHPEALIGWAEAPAQLVHPNVRWLARLLALAAIATAILWIESGTKTPFFSVLIIEAAIAALLHKRTTEVLHATAHAFDDLKLLSALVARIERESFTTSQLQNIRKSLVSKQLPASKAIARLATIAGYIDSLENPIVHFLDIPLLYSVQTAYAAEAWRRVHGSAVRRWLEAIGEAEALLSISAYSYEHPADSFPDLIEDGQPLFDATQLGHPLIPAAKCIRNNVSIGGVDAAQALLISGSNMSGKSTLLRAIGINTVLAMAGAPVRAESLRLTALHVGASILINDSLQQGSSRFYAEIIRLRRIADLAEKSPPLLFLLDELLQGTNSKDRLTGAAGVVRALLDAGAIGLISTHDLALTHIGSNNDHRLHNVHFQDEIEDGRMKFDYTLRDGVVTHSNGIELMRLIGLKV